MGSQPLTTDKLYSGYRNPDIIRAYSHKIHQAAQDLDRPVNIMEVCGGHTFSIVKYGLDQLVPDSIRFIHGPGCPVCVLPQHRIDASIALASMEDTILVTLGDMIKIPGSRTSLQHARAEGRDVRFVYTPLDAIKIATENPHKKVIYFAIGFETTTPMTALLIEQSRQLKVNNLFFHINHVLVPPAIELILQQGGHIDAFIGPGHVTTITGTGIYEPFALQHHKPVVISGFEPIDVLDAVLKILLQLCDNKAIVENCYSRSAKPEGNLKAQALVSKYFETREDFIWRGIGTIENSAMKLRDEYVEIDAEQQFSRYCPRATQEKTSGCLCGQILMGHAQPKDCALFGKGCTPSSPQGSCMVSNEGACAAYYRYRRY